MAANPETAVAVIEQSADSGVVEWNLDGFPENAYNRLVPVATLQIPTDLLRPVVQVVQLNPDPKNGGDVYTSNDTPAGHAAPTKVGLRKLAMAAGISFVDERRTDDGTNPDVIEVTCVAELLMPTGQRIRATGMKRVDLTAQVWRSPEHRAKYKSFFLEHVASRAQNRAIRALLSLRGSYPIEIYQRPFAVVSFAPNMNHPEVRARMLDAMTGASAQLYGPSGAKELGAGKTINVTPAAEEDPAPATPTELPGEKLAKAAGPVDEPDWLKPSTPAAAAAPTTKRRGAKSLPERLRESFDASELKGDATESQQLVLRELAADLPWATELYPVLAAAFGPDWDGRLSAPHAQAILNVAEAYEAADPPIDFAAAWREASAAVRKAAEA